MFSFLLYLSGVRSGFLIVCIFDVWQRSDRFPLCSSDAYRIDGICVQNMTNHHKNCEKKIRFRKTYICLTGQTMIRRLLRDMVFI